MLKITPKNNIIEFQIELENSTINETSTRLIVKVGDDSDIVPLSLDSNGNVKGEIPLKENWDGKRGNIIIEVITSDVYFSPFEQEVIFEDIPKSPKATIKEITLTSKKPTIKEESKIKINQKIEEKEVVKKEVTLKPKPTVQEVKKPKNISSKVDKEIVDKMMKFFK